MPSSAGADGPRPIQRACDGGRRLCDQATLLFGFVLAPVNSATIGSTELPLMGWSARAPLPSTAQVLNLEQFSLPKDLPATLRQADRGVD